MFDAFGNALAVLLGAGPAARSSAVLDHGQDLLDSSVTGMIPAFWPPIHPGDPGWDELKVQYRDIFSNHPYRYHNGGVWPMVSGWWALALLARGRRKACLDLLTSIHRFNDRTEVSGKGFHEYGDWATGQPGGTPWCSWSAAAVVLVEAALTGRWLEFVGGKPGRE